MLKWISKGVLAGLICGLIWMLYSVIVQIVENSPVFTIKTVEIRGNRHSNVLWLKDLYLGNNIFTGLIPAQPIRENEWIDRIEITRIMPDKLLITVYEDTPVLLYKSGDKCSIRTVGGNDIPSLCGEVSVVVDEAGAEEFKSFAGLYSTNEVLRINNVVLKNGFFWISEGSTTLKGNFVPGVFSDNYKIYTERIKPRYKKIDSVDLTVKGKVYVKGVLNG